MTALAMTGVLADFRPRFFDGLTPSDLRVVVASATQRRVRANSVVTNHGDLAQQFFLLTRGRARFFYITEGGRKLILHWLAPGEIFGAMALLPSPYPYLVSTEMVKDSLVLVWDRATIQQQVARYPQLALNAMTTAAEYLSMCVASRVAMVCQNARERLAEVLLNLARGIGQEVEGGIELDITNEELANAANITPFTTSRLLSEWRRTGAVIKSRGKLIVRSPDRLFVRRKGSGTVWQMHKRE